LDIHWLVPQITLLGLITLLFIMVWFSISKRSSCPKPNKCDWLGIGWITMQTGWWVSMYMNVCCDIWWWSVIFVLGTLAVLLVFLWIKKCTKKFNTIIAYLIIWLLAGLCVYYLIANKILENCLR